MSTNQLTPTYIAQAVSLAADFVSVTVPLAFEDNVGIQAVWTGTPTGTLAVQISMDPTVLGWQTVTFSPSPTQPTGSAGSNWFSIQQTDAAFLRLTYTRVSGTGTLNAKIAAKSV